MSTILVTGSSGFVGSHVLLAALKAGHRVRATLRSPAREAAVREAMRGAGVMADERLQFLLAELEHDAGWPEAMAGCDYVLHVASPMPKGEPRDENEVIVPARDGVLRVLRAARAAGVKRVVLTSSCGAVYYGHPEQAAPFDETSWTNTAGQMSAYVKSKALAERAAWDFMQREGGALELSVINPAGVFGPVLGPDFASSTQLVQRLLKGGPGVPRLFFAVVDVRDVAELHLLAMTSPDAKGERFIAVAGPSLPMIEVARMLRARLGEQAKRVPTRQLPDWIVRAVALFSPQMKQLLPLLGKVRNATSAKAQRVLGWQTRPTDETIAATGESLLRFGLVPAGG